MAFAASWLLTLLLTSLVSAAALGPRGVPKGHKEFDLYVTWGTAAPDGFARDLFLVNGQTPGPVLDIDQGDSVVVRVHNKSPFNMTTHFHGIEMMGTPWSDGVPGVTQRPIEPSSVFEYKFDATQHGSYWYHSHFRSQIEDGLYGPIVVHPRPGAPKPFGRISSDKHVIRALEEAERKVRPLAIADYSHYNASLKTAAMAASRVEVSCYDAVVFNGRGRINCLDPAEVKAHLTPDQKTFLSLVPGSEMTDKSCLPIDVVGAISEAGGNGHANTDKIPRGIFEGCTPTNGSLETVHSPGDWVAIDLVGSINFITAVVSIDEHDMWVYAIDGGYIEPQKVQAITVTNGDRYSVLVHTPHRGDFKIRAHANSAPQMVVGNAILSVKGGSAPGQGSGSGFGNLTTSSTSWIDITGSPVKDGVTFFNQAASYPFPPEPIAQTSDQTFVLHMKNDGAQYLWAMNTTGLVPDSIGSSASLPTLFDPQPWRADNHTITTKNDTWVDLVFLADASPMPSHPIHKHSNKMFQIGQGNGTFNWTSVNDAVQQRPDLFNLVNPPRRDTFISPPAVATKAWTAVRYHVVNPGAFLLHCHIETHMAGGMMVIIQDGVDAWPKIPQEYWDRV